VKDKHPNIRFGSGSREKISIIVAGALVSALAIGVVVNYYQRMRSQGAYRSEYEGRVVNKWVTYHETEFGTRISRHLLIKSKNGEVFQVSVSPDLYEQAKVDQWVIKDKNGIQILASEP
jgi:hypothetical protein